MIGRSHRVVAEEQIGKFARIVGGLVYIAGKRRVDLLSVINHRFAVADLVLAEIGIGVCLRRTVRQRDRSGITGEGKGLCAVDVPAVKADKFQGGIGINSLLTIDITADVTLEIRSSLCRTVFADDCGAFFRPNAVIVGAEDHIEQIGIGRAGFTGDLRKNTKISCLRRRVRSLGRRFLAGRQAEYQNKPKKQGNQAGLCLHRESPFSFQWRLEAFNRAHHSIESHPCQAPICRQNHWREAPERLRQAAAIGRRRMRIRGVWWSMVHISM